MLIMVNFEWYSKDLILNISIIVFFLMFCMISLVVFVIIRSLFKKTKYTKYEPSISILIPAYNEEKNIEETLNSVFASTYPKKKLEVIVIDDGSTDNTLGILERLKKRYSNLVILKGNHKGKSASLNLGLKHSSHDYILLIDADTTIRSDAIAKIISPFNDKSVGATTGSCLVKNSKGILGAFQEVEYPYINLIRKSFSDVFSNVSWFLGAFSCYRKDVLKSIGNFKKDTQSEDIDTSLEIYSKGYKILNVFDAYAYTTIPLTIKGFVKQRIRWYVGVLQVMKKHKKVFSSKTSFAINYLFINQVWWTIYAFLSIPLIAYQYNYWLNLNSGSFFEWFMYTFNWFSFFGSVKVIYMIPVWGISLVSLFGVLAGIVSLYVMIYAIYVFDKKMSLKKVFALLFYFPYTIFLNVVVIIGFFNYLLFGKKYFKK